MDYPNHNTKTRKNKYLNLSERSKIEILLEEGYSVYQIAKRLGRAQNTILSEIKRGSTLQRKGNNVVTKDQGCTLTFKVSLEGSYPKGLV